MVLPVTYLPREGDVLVIHAEVKFDVAPADKWIHLKVGLNNFAVDRDDPVGIKRRTWKPEDWVEHRNRENVFGQVIATHEDYVWILLHVNSASVGKSNDAGGLVSFHCNELQPRLVFDRPAAPHPLNQDPSWRAPVGLDAGIPVGGPDPTDSDPEEARSLAIDTEIAESRAEQEAEEQRGAK